MDTVVDGGGITEIVEQVIDRQLWLDRLAERLQKWLSAALRRGGPRARRAKDLFNGTWVGHPLHPALSDAALGAWFTGTLFDLAGAESCADRAIGLGVLAALPTAASGVADWHDQSGKPRRTGLVHAFLNGSALLCYMGSLAARRASNRPLGVGLSTTGLALAMGGAYLGGELVFAQGTGVDRNAWAPTPEGWHVAASLADLVEAQLTRAEIAFDGNKLPLVLLKTGHEILALGATCSHMGGPLGEGKLVDERCVECPWHGSRFDMMGGRVARGPAAHSQPRYATRQRDGKVEVRLLR